MAKVDEEGQGASTAYEVGNKKPPKHTQFKPGHSGNPKGRPKGSQNLATLVEKELRKPVTVTSKGKPVKMPKKRVIAIQLVDSAAKGDLKAAQYVALLEAQSSASVTQSPSGSDPRPPSRENLKFLAGRLAAWSKEEGE